MTKDNLTTNASDEAESPAFLVGAVMLSCPFCGGEAKKTFIGNNHTKSRKIEVKCTKCFTKQVTATIKYGFDKCEEWANEKWNSRVGGHGA
jgi:hypothetical protein